MTGGPKPDDKGLILCSLEHIFKISHESEKLGWEYKRLLKGPYSLLDITFFVSMYLHFLLKFLTILINICRLQCWRYTMRRSTICYQQIYHMLWTCFEVEENDAFLPSPLLMFAVLKRFCLFCNGIHETSKHNKRRKFNVLNVHITWICLIFLLNVQISFLSCPNFI
jgi:hypothetical protein